MRKLAIVVALSSTVLATPALARDGAWYVGVEGGAMIVEDIDLEVIVDGDDNNLDVGTLDSDDGWDVGGTVGYDLGSFRIEAEVAYKHAELDQVFTTIALPGDNPNNFATVRDAGGSTRILSGMINGMLDFGDDDGVQGFVGGGVGVARVKFDNQRVFDNQAPFFDESDTRFAWQIIAGVRQAITDNIDVTLKYRFFNVPNLEIASFTGDSAQADLRSHSILGGLAFNFGTPEVILPPPPPPPPYVPPPPPPPPPFVAPTPVGPFIVFFDWDRSEITPQAAAILDNAASAYQQTGSANVMLAGNADKSGSDEYNVGLSQRRADAVRSYLAGRGIPEGAMSTEAYGESRPLVETADGVREPQNRNVQITFGPGSGM